MKKRLLKSAISVAISILIIFTNSYHVFSADENFYEMKGQANNMEISAQTELTVIPRSMMKISANTFNPNYMPGNVIDGDVNTMWHSEWSPNAPFPHILTIEFDRKIALSLLSVLPRQDADAGKITSGQIYVGDSLESMTLLTAFVGDASRNASIIELNQTKARFIQIYSLATNGTNTAISEITLKTSDGDMLTAFDNYYVAVDLLRKAKTGNGVGKYAQEDVDDFKRIVEDLYIELIDESLSNSEYRDISGRISSACEDFVLKAKVYDKSDLIMYIESLTDLTGGITVSEDMTAANSLLDKANIILSKPNASNDEIHNVIIELISFTNSISSTDESVCSLSGEWNLALSAYSDGMQLTDSVNLPGTLDTNMKGTYNSDDDINRLSRLFKYTGPATYQKSVYISGKWSSENITLYMERSRITRVWVNGTEVNSPESSGILPVAQKYDITKNLNYGQFNTITIVVDNSYSNLPDFAINSSHMATDETQTNWNGILGKFELQIKNKIHIDDLRVYPNNDLESVKAEVDVKNTSLSAYSGTVTLSCPNAASRNISVNLAAGESRTFTISDYEMPENLSLWSEFDTTTYEMTASLDNGYVIKTDFGMRVFSKNKSDDIWTLEINGKRVFLRNETNCAMFPITGYAPMDEESWEDLFNTYKSYGINSIRFHSWCPPKAAFYAADKLGLYLQPELSAWEGGMFDTSVKRNYFAKEAYAIVKEYANHPSFVMFSFGNELGYSQGNYQYANQLIQGLKQKDSTRLYAPGSNQGHGGINPSPNSDFHSSQHFMNEEMRGSYGGLDGFVNETPPSSAVNFDDAVKNVFTFNVPFFGFEVGQYQVFPDVLTETQKYTGVLDARNFKMVSEKINQKGLSNADVADAINASGMLSRIAYKAEIEAALRTKGMSGISLLGIQDFGGQGTALVGMMNAFGEPKPYAFADPNEFSSFFNPTVVLFESTKFTYKNNESLTGNILLSNFSSDDISEKVNYKLSYKGGTVFHEGETDFINFKQGELTTAAQISIPLDAITVPTQFKFEVSCLQSRNNYDIWVYPDENQIDDEEIYVTDYLDETATTLLENGGKVFLSPRALKTAFPNSRNGKFSTAFWSTYDKTQPGTMGLLLNPEHSLFEAFPTDYHSDYQWWAMARYGRPMNLETLTDKNGKKVKPIIKVLDGFEKLENLGLLYEIKVGSGKVVVSSMNLDNLKYEYIEAQALRDAIIKYMKSDDFNPEAEVDIAKLNEQIKIVSSDKNNLALGKNVFHADAINSSEWSEENLTDGVIDSRPPNLYGYSTNNSYPLTQTDLKAGFVIDLGQATEFNKVILYPRTDVVVTGTTDTASNFPRTFEIQASDDLNFSEYDTLSSQTNITTTINRPLSLEFNNTTKRYIRLFVTQVGVADGGSQGRVQLTEFEVYKTENVKGDVDGSGTVTAYDALLTLQIATGKLTPNSLQKDAADVFENDAITAANALRILQFAIGAITSF